MNSDFGPLHIDPVYRYDVLCREFLRNLVHKDRLVVFWSKLDPKSRANTACLLACYMAVIHNWPPHLGLEPFAKADPPYMPFRDAGYNQADFMISVQDVVYGVWRDKKYKYSLSWEL